MKKVLLIVGLIIIVIIAAGGFYFWEIYQHFTKVETVQLDPQLIVYLGGGGNSIVLTSEDGTKALVVDTKMRKAAKKLRGEVKAAEITIVNTHAHFDHTGGNALYPAAKIISGAYTNEQWDNDSWKSKYPDLALKPGEEKVIKIGSETVHICNMGRAHTWNDVIVYCEKRKLLVTGDVVFIDMHPALHAKSGANVASWIGVLDSLSQKYKIKTLIPGHGKISDQTALAVMKDYFVSIGDAIEKPEKQAELKKKYKDYFTIPGVFSFRNTTKFIEKERKGK